MYVCILYVPQIIFLHIIYCPVYITDPNCERHELNFDIQSVSFDRFSEHGSCHIIFPADAGFLCDQAALLGENIRHPLLTFKAYWLRHQTTGLAFKNFTFCPHCIYVFCIYLRTNSDLCHLQHKRIGFCNRDEKCLQRGTDWVFK
jgi:hypothetical protein